MNLFTVSAALTLDKSAFNRGVDQAERQARNLDASLGSRFGRIASGIAKTMGTAFAVAGAATIRFAKSAMGAAGELEQQIGGSEAVFGEYAKYIQEQGAEAYKNLGLSQQDYLANANKMASLMKGTGMDTGEAVELTTKAMQRASDVASIMGISVQDAMYAIQGAAKGNFTMMDNLGVAINNTAIQAYALEKGMDKKAVKSMSTQKKVQLAFQMFLEKSEYAAGNYAKENDTLAGSLTTLRAAFANLMSGAGGADEVSMALDMALGSILKTFEKLAPKVIDSLGTLLEKVSPKLPGLLQRIMPSILDGVTMLLNALTVSLPALLKSLVDSLPEIITGLTNLVPNLVSGMVAIFTVVFHQLPEILSSLVTSFANGVIELINNVFGTNIPKIDKIKFPSWQEIKSFVTGKINAIIDGINGYFKINLPHIDSITLPTWAGIKEYAENRLNSIIRGINRVLGLKLPAIKDIRLPTWRELEVKALVVLSGIVNSINRFFGTNIPTIKRIRIPAWSEIQKYATVILNGTVDGINKFFGTHLPYIADIHIDGEKILNRWQEWKTAHSDFTTEIKAVPEYIGWVAARFKLWWARNKHEIEQAAKAALQVIPEKISAFKDRITEWWNNGVGAWLLDKLNTTLGIDAPDFAAFRKELWARFVEFDGKVRGWFKTTLGIDIPDFETFKARLHVKYMQVKDGIQAFLKERFGIDIPAFKTIASQIIARYKNQASQKIRDVLRETFHVDLPSLKEVIKQIKEWWQQVLKEVGELGINAFFNSGIKQADTETGARKTEQGINAGYTEQGTIDEIALANALADLGMSGFSTQADRDAVYAQFGFLDEEDYKRRKQAMTATEPEEPQETPETYEQKLLRLQQEEDAKRAALDSALDSSTQNVVSAFAQVKSNEEEMALGFDILPDSLGSAAQRALSGWGVYMDGQLVGSLVAPTVNEYIGTVGNIERYGGDGE